MNTKRLNSVPLVLHGRRTIGTEGHGRCCVPCNNEQSNKFMTKISMMHFIWGRNKCIMSKYSSFKLFIIIVITSKYSFHLQVVQYPSNQLPSQYLPTPCWPVGLFSAQILQLHLHLFQWLLMLFLLDCWLLLLCVPVLTLLCHIFWPLILHLHTRVATPSTPIYNELPLAFSMIRAGIFHLPSTPTLSSKETPAGYVSFSCCCIIESHKLFWTLCQ